MTREASSSHWRNSGLLKRDAREMLIATLSKAIWMVPQMKQHNLADVLDSLQESHFFGSLEIKFEAGRVVLLRKTETIKPDNRRDNRGENEQRQHGPSA
jgi:hypothetical protein